MITPPANRNGRGGQPQKPPRVAAYQELTNELRREIQEKQYRDGRSLPTEAELSKIHGVSRQTVRRAFQELVAEGFVYRVPGRGTFAREDVGKYVRPSGSLEDLLAIGVDTELEMISPPHAHIDVEIARRMQLDSDRVVSLTYRRFYSGEAYGYVSAYVPEDVGHGLLEVEDLREIGSRHRMTVLGFMQSLMGVKFVRAEQSITAVRAPEHMAKALDVEEGSPLLRIDRAYHDSTGRMLEIAINHYNPAKYSYRLEMRSATA
jgi:GntR family transcriptional regulator